MPSNYTLGSEVPKGEALDVDGVRYRDGSFNLPDRRHLAWRWWGEPGHRTVLRLQGTPGSRFHRHPNPSVWREAGVCMLTADRPGFGGSSRLPGRGLSAVADDLADLLDALGLDRVPVISFSGGGPHALALAARHPDRISAVAVMVGAAPLAPEERGRLVGVNRAGLEAAEQGWDALHKYLEQVRQRMFSEGGVRGLLDDAPAEDREIMADPAWQRIDRANTIEALRQSAEGWADETLAIIRAWDFHPIEVRTSVTWWHGTNDANAPLSAAERVVTQIPEARLHVWHHEGHFAAIRHESEAIQELLSRA
jgi:pimeloyl-ACP methyl ester carboxylesterase